MTNKIDAVQVGVYPSGAVALTAEATQPWPPIDTPLQITVEWEGDIDARPDVKRLTAERDAARAKLLDISSPTYPNLNESAVLAAAMRYKIAVKQRARLIANIVSDEANLSLKSRPMSTP